MTRRVHSDSGTYDTGLPRQGEQLQISRAKLTIVQQSEKCDESGILQVITVGWSNPPNKAESVEQTTRITTLNGLIFTV